MANAKDILLHFIQGEEGKAWAFGRTGWSTRSHASVCQWDGITCDENLEHVTEISLPLADFSATIPTEIGELSFLRKIDLQHNLVAGTIPSQLFGLPALEEVNLAGNILSGGLMTFTSGSLKSFDISSNHLNGTIPEDFGKSNVQLSRLDLRENQLWGTIPSSLETLTLLVQLSLSKNSLSGALPNSLGASPKLKYLYLSDNHLVGTIPPAWGVKGSQVTEVWLQNNMLSGPIPSSLSHLTQLLDFYVDGNKLTGTVPDAICSPKINSDFFETAPKQLNSHYCSAISCPVGTIAPEGVAPCSPCNSTTIFNPYLGRQGECHNQTETDIVAMLLAKNSTDSSKIPIQLDSACHYQGVTCNQQGRVVRIDASGMGLSGTIPDEIGFLQFLKSLNLSDNKLVGFLPSGLRFAPLEDLDISGNQLEGVVPPLLCKSAINGNGVNGVHSCNAIACPVGWYSKTGWGECQSCDNGSVPLGSKSCVKNIDTSPASTQTRTEAEKSHAGTIIAIVLVAAIVAASVIGIRFVLSRRLKRRKQHPQNVERGQIIRDFKGVPNFAPLEEVKRSKTPSRSVIFSRLRLPPWFGGKSRSRSVVIADDERLDFRATMSSDEVDDSGWKEGQQFIIDDDDDQSELERIVRKQKLEGSTEVWEYPDPLERSLASWSADDDLNADYDNRRNSSTFDHPQELWLDVPRV